jgi:hypothetical protein
MEQTTTGRQTMHLRLPVDLYAELKAYADRTHRSVNSAAVHLVSLGLEREAAGSVFSPDAIHTR